jgi:spore coat protein U-like protein
MRFALRILPALALVALAAPAFAQPINTSTLTIKAQVIGSCKVTDLTPLLTITYDVFDTNTAQNSTGVKVKCTKGTTVYLSAGASANGGAGGFLRSVSDGTNKIGYKLTVSSGGAELLVDGPGVTTGQPSAGKNTDVSVPIWATLDTVTVPDPIPGNYTDTVVLTYTAL